MLVSNGVKGMSKVSIIIPSRVELFQITPGVSVLQRTIQDIYENATGDFEVIVAFDGPPYQKFPDYPNLKCLELEWRGTKPAINSAASVADGKYLFKADSHCMFAKGFDEVLQIGMQDNWVVTPRLYILEAENWRWQDNRFYDYYFLPCPFTDKKGFRFQAGGHWKDRTKSRLDIPLDENMKLHGSAWFMAKDFFWNCLEGLDANNGAGTWNGEDIEITMKTWLGPWDGKLIANKDTWYAHMHRDGQRPREWGVSHTETHRSALWTANYWMSNQWSKQVHDIGWLIDRFSPVPSWPDNWHKLYEDYNE